MMTEPEILKFNAGLLKEELNPGTRKEQKIWL